MKEKFEALRSAVLAAYGEDPDCADVLDILQRGPAVFYFYLLSLFSNLTSPTLPKGTGRTRGRC